MAEFENTSTRIEVSVWYSINDVPAMESRGKMYMPISAKFTFLDGGDCSNLVLNVKAVKQNGDYAKNTIVMPDIYLWDQKSWPEWLHELHDQAHAELRPIQVFA